MSAEQQIELEDFHVRKNIRGTSFMLGRFVFGVIAVSSIGYLFNELISWNFELGGSLGACVIAATAITETIILNGASNDNKTEISSQPLVRPIDNRGEV